MKRKLLSIALTLSILGAAITGCGNASASGNKEAEVEIIQEDEVATTDDASSEDAAEESSEELDLTGTTLKVWGMAYTPDLFKAAGVDDVPYDLSFETFSGGALALQAIAVDQLDLAQSSEIPPLFASLTGNGGNFKIVAGYSGATLGQQLIAGPGQDIKSVAELKGKKVGYVEATTAHYFLAKMLEAAGLTWDDIEAVPLAPSDGLSALISGDIVAFAVFGFPQINANEEAGGYMIETAQDILSGNYIYNANVQSLKDPKKRAAIIDYLTRMQKVYIWEKDHIEEYAEITKEYTSLDHDAYIKQLQDEFAQKPTTVFTNNDEAAASFQDVADTLYGLGVLEKEIDVKTLYTDDISEELQKNLDELAN
ncbi:ABC transporter substrate-binding protein [Butyrivibrio sp. LC3010]|uniref:ABC transporter substrate-binding protein n=1 Tax=Butyrivibrio sp. LC3010 TaxID=1280680 RepID=UPI00040B0D48|nr:ABC transporter substrate-binding protein [Butyrivibrio sp. LC3010]